VAERAVSVIVDRYTIKRAVGQYSLRGPGCPRGMLFETAQKALGFLRHDLKPRPASRVEVYGPDRKLFRVVEVPAAESARNRGG
jgi:hypothetical protein